MYWSITIVRCTGSTVTRREFAYYENFCTQYYFAGLFFPQSVSAQPPGTEWTQTIGGPYIEGGTSVIQTSNGDFVVVGMRNSPGADSIDVYLIKLETDTGIEEAHGGNPLLALETAVPNLFSSTFTITYSIPEQSSVKLAGFDLSGRLVEKLVNGQRSGGTHTVTWSPALEMPSGYYIIKLDACGFNETVRCLRLN